MPLPPIEFVRSPEALGKIYSPEEGRAYTRWLATHHYENFHVVSFLLPKRLHQDFYNVYAYCRWADDLGDETGDRAESLRLLEWWRGELDAMYQGRATHPVFAALLPTVERYGIPRQPFAGLHKVPLNVVHPGAKIFLRVRHQRHAFGGVNRIGERAQRRGQNHQHQRRGYENLEEGESRFAVCFWICHSPLATRNSKWS